MKLSTEKWSALMKVLANILDERERQEEKWGQQDHDDGKWALILLEEIGEASETALGDGRQGGDLRAELVQTAAVVVAWIEALDRRAP